MMNWKILSAFMTGALIASGIVYMAVKPGPEQKPATVAAIEIPPPKPAAAPQASEEPPAAPAPSAEPAEPSAARPSKREKPSPMPPPVHREKPATVARNEPPQEPVPPSVAAPPVNPPEAKPADPPPPPPAKPAPPEPAAPPEDAPKPEPEVRVPHTVTIAAGTMLPVRIGETLSSARAQPGDSFLATLEQPLVVDGFIIAERGARVEGRVVESEPAGRTKGLAQLGIQLVKLNTTDGQHIRIRTEPYKQEGRTTHGTDAAKIGAGAAIGAIIGAAAGGGKGAAIGAGVGGAAGTADVLLTRGKPAEIAVETRVSFRLQDSVTITERLE